MPNSSNNNKLQGCRPVHFWKVKKLNDCHDATLYKAYLHVVDRRIFVLVHQSQVFVVLYICCSSHRSTVLALCDEGLSEGNHLPTVSPSLDVGLSME